MQTSTSSIREHGEVACVLPDLHGDERARCVATDLAERLGLELALIGVSAPVPPAGSAAVGGPYAIPPEVVPPPDPAVDPPEALAKRRAALARLAEDARVGARADAIVASAAEAAAEVAASPQTALLVVADDGAGPLMGRLAGEPARKVLRDAACPVVVVPPGEPERLDGRSRVICGLADTPEAASVAAVAGDLAVGLGGRLTCVHAAGGQPSASPPVWAEPTDLHPADVERIDALVHRCRAALPETASAIFECVVGDAAQALREAAIREDAALVVVGRPSHGAFVSALVGSVTHTLLEECERPVVVAPAAQDRDGTA
jgi:nucleotide-binding universal stress UspA family protein